MPRLAARPLAVRRLLPASFILSGLACPGLIVPGQATAQTTAPPSAAGTPHSLPEVSVSAPAQTADTPVSGYVAERDRTATKTDTPLLETPQSVDVVTRDQMDEQDVHTLNGAVRYTAGVAPETRGGIATRYDMLKIRGFDADLYLNGMKLMDNGWYAIPQLDPYLMERIDILKGPSSILYGQAQAGGLVNMVSKMPTETPLHEIGFEFGNFAHLQSTFDFSGPLDAEGKYLYRITGIGLRENGQVSGTLNERIAIAPSFTWRPDGDTSLTLMGIYQHDPYATSYGAIVPQGSVLFNPFGTIPVNFYDGDKNFEKFDRTQISLGYKFDKRLNDVWSVSSNGRWFHINQDYASVYTVGLEPDFRTLDRATAASRDTSDLFTFDNRVQARFDTGPVSHTVLAGFDVQHLGSDYTTGFGAAPTLDMFAPDHAQAIVQPSRYTMNVAANQYGLYLQDQLKLGGFVLTLSGRQDWIDSDQRNRTFGTDAKQSASAFTSRAGLAYVFDTGIAPYFAYSESFTPVLGSDAYGNAFVPERSHQYEVGVKYQPTRFNALFTAALFDLTRQNLLTADPVNPSNSIQSGEARSRGVELEARTSLSNNLNLIAAYTFLDTIYTKDNSGLQDKHLPAVPSHLVSAWAYYTIPGGTLDGLSLGAGVRYIGPSYSADNSFKVPGVALVDAAIRYDLGKALPRLSGAEVHVNAQNLLDARYVASCYYGNWCAYGYQRQVYAGLTYRW
ncbi:MAG TPA: TonB-dependent siderophore receptor [Rhodopila sp.]|uniref:TonB-dependent siderophore receptor n=1 Tax=Rhodopila sp. TaxID=2480087 RepID=UPI002CF8295B|nr:TonB-dependent siderophore receptor [Rhodopila sp.]HVY16254.1 TonB-dependent siderophore receptor [Rhodopila sp.]